jgi:hypothetical protein
MVAMVSLGVVVRIAQVRSAGASLVRSDHADQSPAKARGCHRLS